LPPPAMARNLALSLSADDGGVHLLLGVHDKELGALGLLLRDPAESWDAEAACLLPLFMAAYGVPIKFPS
jgi:hypothetical protein